MIVREITSVEPSKSAAWTTSIVHSGWTMTCTSGYSARAFSICLTLKRRCTEHQPFQRITFARSSSSRVLPPSEPYGSV